MKPEILFTIFYLNWNYREELNPLEITLHIFQPIFWNHTQKTTNVLVSAWCCQTAIARWRRDDYSSVTGFVCHSLLWTYLLGQEILILSIVVMRTILKDLLSLRRVSEMRWKHHKRSLAERSWAMSLRGVSPCSYWITIWIVTVVADLPESPVRMSSGHKPCQGQR